MVGSSLGVGSWELGVALAGVSEEFAGGANCLFDLPERGAAIEAERYLSELEK